MSETNFQILQTIVDGVPWTEESAKSAGHVTLNAARTRVLGSASFLDDDEWDELYAQFETVVNEAIQHWGPADFRGKGSASGYTFFNRPPEILVERLALWKKPNCIAFISLELGDNTRMRGIFCGERSEDELQESDD